MQYHIKALDGFRGLAILLVMFYHYQKEWTFGWMGVDLFFLLSGFLITGKLIQAYDNKAYYRQFYRNRVLRVVPLYYLVLVGFFGLLPLVAPWMLTPSYRSLQDTQAYYWMFAANLWDAKHGWPENITLVHFWSLAAEMQFYLVWPLVVKLIFRRNGITFKLIMAALILSAPLFRIYAPSVLDLSLVSRYSLLPSRIDDFAAGALLYVIIHRYGNRFRKLFLAVFIIALIAIGLVVSLFQLEWHYAENIVWTWGFTLVTLLWSGLMGYTILSKGTLQKLFETALLRQSGKYSYGMYVFHLPVYIFLENMHLEDCSLVSAAVLITVALGVASYHLFEKFFLRLKGK